MPARYTETGARHLINPHPLQLVAFSGLLLLVSHASAEITAARQSELLYLLRHDCGACHGMSLQGGLGPPLQPDALAGRTVAALQVSILEGREGTAMPPWRGILTEEDARWLSNRLLQGISVAP
ncbi:MAG: cytochrome c [Gammaproteobacteria bacterium]